MAPEIASYERPSADVLIEQMTRLRQVTAVFAIVAGVALMAAAPALSLFDRMAAAERVSDRFRPLVTGDGLTKLEANIELLGGAQAELTDEALPRFADELGLAQAELDRLIATQFPAVARGLSSIPMMVGFVSETTIGLAAIEREYLDADTLPGLGLPLNTIPWIIVGLGGAADSGFGWPWKLHGRTQPGSHPDLGGFVPGLHGRGLKVLGYLNPFLGRGKTSSIPSTASPTPRPTADPATIKR